MGKCLRRANKPVRSGSGAHFLRQPGRGRASPSRRQYRRRRLSIKHLLTLVTIVPLLGLALLDQFGPEGGFSFIGAGYETASARLVAVSWVDGDSGRLNGKEFRLHGVDAPEGSPSRAECAAERRKADVSRAAARTLTAGRQVVVTRSYGEDRYGRELVDLSLDGRDVAGSLTAAGHLKRWRFEAGQAKPNWC